MGALAQIKLSRQRKLDIDKQMDSAELKKLKEEKGWTDEDVIAHVEWLDEQWHFHHQLEYKYRYAIEKRIVLGFFALFFSAIAIAIAFN